MAPQDDRQIGAFYAQLGDRVRAAREQLGLTQGALAEKVGLTRTSITNIEKGRQKLLLHTFTGLADALKKDAAELLPPKLLPGAPVVPAGLPPAEAAFLRGAISTITKGKS